MSGSINILEYLRPKADRVRRGWGDISLVPLRFGLGSSDDSDQDGASILLRRHLRFDSNTLGIEIRQIRRVGVPMGAFARRVEHPENKQSPGIAARAVASYARKGRTSSYWQDSGWERRDDHLIGHYRAGGRSFDGSIELLGSVVQPTRYHIYDPPAAVLRGPHGACFRSEGKVCGLRKYWIHFSEEPQDIDSGIIQIEKDLAAAIGAS